MSKDLTALLRAAIEQRKALAEEASPSPWSANAEGTEVVAVDGITVCDGFALSSRQLRATVGHIVANDPEAVLARCKADLATLDHCEKYLGTPQEESTAMMMWHATRLAEATIANLAEGYGIAEEDVADIAAKVAREASATPEETL